ncbi:MAG: hypothetical protein N2C14_04075, partial [Planctomycetales bacterium]
TGTRMGFLKRFFHNVFREEYAGQGVNVFEKLDEHEVEAHLDVSRYENFLLTDAVRPSFDLQVVPREGYRRDLYRDEESRGAVPVLLAAVSRENLFDVFMELLDPLGDEVDAVLETSHRNHGSGHEDLYREQMDLPVLKSTLWDYEDLLLNDGFTGIAALNPNIPREVQFDEHKLLIMYADDLAPFEAVLKKYGLVRDDRMKFITEGEHVHSSTDDFQDRFQELQMRLGMDGSDCFNEGYDEGYGENYDENFI